jgi:DNA end-binding protein Ku
MENIMARAMWNGTLSFGLLNIPISVFSAKEQKTIHFNLLDKKDYGRIGYKQINKNTGREVSKKDIVKGYEYEPDQFVLLTPKDFEKANPKASESIDIEDFVELEEIDPLLFERPYYLSPAKNGVKGYELLRKVMEETKKIAIGKIVLHGKQRLVAVMARGEHLVLEILRYAREVLSADEIELPNDDKLKKVKISEKEINMAKELVNGMTSPWQPEKYKDTYQNDLMKMIKNKVRGGGAIESEAPEKEEEEQSDRQVLDLMPLLKKSLEQKGKSPRTAKKGKKHVTKRIQKKA